MDGATASERPSMLSAVLAGLQAGMLGVCWMLLWLGISAVWQRRSFWTPEDLMASAFFGEDAVYRGLASRTLAGLALYLTIYSALGALFAMAVRDRMPRPRVLLVSVLFALSWYFLSLRLIWKNMAPVLWLLQSAPPTELGHVIFGAVLGRYPVYLPRPAAAAIAAEVAAPEV